jgi:glycerophosphoryl diester phosphodiesterase
MNRMVRPAAKLTAFLIAITLFATPGFAFDLEGHRGARGLLPENTLPAFAKAMDIGVTTLELDLCVTADGFLVVSHDLVLNPNHTRTDDGNWVTDTDLAIRTLTVDEVQSYDVGRINPDSRYAKKFPHQQPVDDARIPTLAQVFDLVRERHADHVRFNIETKINPEKPDLTVTPQTFAERLIEELKRHNMTDRSEVQSFDWRTLAEVQKLAPTIPTVYLSAQRSWLDNIRAGQPGPSPWTAGIDVDDYGGSVPKAVKAAGGKVWSPYWRDLTAESLKDAHDAGLTVVVWTVDDVADMEKLMDLGDGGVDGIITDYPDRLHALLEKRGYKQDPKTGEYTRGM